MQRLKDAVLTFWTDNQSAIVKLVLGFLLAVGGAVLNQTVRDPSVVEKQTVVEKVVEKLVEQAPKLDPDDPRNFPNGWVDDQTQVKQAVAQMQPPVFADTPAAAMAELPKEIYGWKYYLAFNPRGPPVKNQGRVGSCVSFGTDGAVEKTLAAEIAAGNKKFTFTTFTEECTYGLSRVEIGGGQIRGDGSVGAWAAQAVTKYGLLPRGVYGDIDTTTYSESRCRAWGSSGPPKSLLEQVARYKVGAATQIKTTDECLRAMANGYFTAVCSNVGFNNRDGSIGTRDKNGVIAARGTWNHCMHIDGFHTEPDGSTYFHITNSWGPNAHTGPVGWGDPPTDGFWVASATVARMLGQGDSWAFSAVPGFPRKNLPDFFVRTGPDAADGPVPVHLVLAPRTLLPKMELVIAW